MKINFKDKKTWIIIGIAVLVIVVAIILIRRNRKKKTEEETKKVEEGSASKLPEAAYPLKPRTSGYATENGSYGWQIKLIQKSLNDINGSKLTLDGKLGPMTKNALSAAFPEIISDGEISAAEFEIICDKIREAYAELGMAYSNNDDLKTLYRG